MVFGFPSYGFVLNRFKEIGYFLRIFRFFFRYLVVYQSIVIYPVVHFLGGERTDITRLFILVGYPLDVVAIDVRKVFHIGDKLVFVFFEYLVQMKTDAVLCELDLNTVKLGILTAYHTIAVFRTGYKLSYFLHDGKQGFLCLFRSVRE